MKVIVCKNCGANSFFEKEGVRICKYCDTKYILSREERVSALTGSGFNSGSRSQSFNTNISINADIQMLLEKCRKEPFNAKRYANRILDIDPTNEEALMILRKK